jgi:hypothetical protein
MKKILYRESLCPPPPRFRITKTTTLIVFALIGISLFVFSNSVFDPFTGNGNKTSPQSIPVSQGPDQATKAKVRASLMRLPLSFEANQGQNDPQVKFLSRSGNHSVFFTPNKIVMTTGGASARSRFLRLRTNSAKNLGLRFTSGVTQRSLYKGGFTGPARRGFS